MVLTRLLAARVAITGKLGRAGGGDGQLVLDMR